MSTRNSLSGIALPCPSSQEKISIVPVPANFCRGGFLPIPNPERGIHTQRFLVPGCNNCLLLGVVEEANMEPDRRSWPAADFFLLREGTEGDKVSTSCACQLGRAWLLRVLHGGQKSKREGMCCSRDMCSLVNLLATIPCMGISPPPASEHATGLGAHHCLPGTTLPLVARP